MGGCVCKSRARIGGSVSTVDFGEEAFTTEDSEGAESRDAPPGRIEGSDGRREASTTAPNAQRRKTNDVCHVKKPICQRSNRATCELLAPNPHPVYSGFRLPPPLLRTASRPMHYTMNAMTIPRTRVVPFFLALAALSASHASAHAQLCVFLTGTAYLQNFNSLPSSGTSNNSNTLPQGWAFSEAGTGGTLTYTADNGTLATGNTYSYGASGNNERAFGELTSGTVQTTLGACFLNNTGLVINSMTIAYTGEMWRLGAADAIADRLDFEFSTNASSIVDEGAGVVWTAVNTLDFVSPNNTAPAGAKDGNAAANRTTTAPVAVIPAGGIPDGGVFYIRWLSIANIGGTNDGLAIDDFKLNINPSGDFDQDRDVDGADFLALQKGLGTNSGASITTGDANRDGAVNLLDLVIWKSQFAAIPPAVAAGQFVPEPAGLALAVAGIAVVVRSRIPPL
jgi:hypothetical protein